MFYFFFQAEDGIRYYKVTGVQTCALPISTAEPFAAREPSRDDETREDADQAQHHVDQGELRDAEDHDGVLVGGDGARGPIQRTRRLPFSRTARSLNPCVSSASSRSRACSSPADAR